VSGENVAFVLTLLGPVARRLRLWPRLGLTLVVIGLFALMTRFEPSVSRASVMAALAAATVTVGRPVARVRVLALAVTALLVIDPLLVRSLGFQLSVAASLAIVTLAAPIAAVLPGPAWCAEPLGVTLAAQLGVAPLLLAAFGPIPLASVPANLLAVPAAGAVMVWGMTGGLLAGVAGGRFASVLHLPTRLLLGWIQVVAARAAAAPLGLMGAPAVAASVAGIALLLVARRVGRPSLRRLGGLAVVGAASLTVVLVHAPPALRTELVPGVVRWHGSGTDVVVLGGGSWRSPVREAVALEALRRGGVRAIDLLVVVSDDVTARTVSVVVGRHPTGTVLVASGRSPDDLPPGAVVAPSGRLDVVVGSLQVLLAPGEGRLVVEAWPRPR
jgi:ComEC/Rec2-related protein